MINSLQYMSQSHQQTYHDSISNLFSTGWNTISKSFQNIIKDIEQVNTETKPGISTKEESKLGLKQFQTNQKEQSTPKTSSNLHKKSLEEEKLKLGESKQNKTISASLISSELIQPISLKQSHHFDMMMNDIQNMKLETSSTQNQYGQSEAYKIDPINQEITQLSSHQIHSSQQPTKRSLFVPSSNITNSNKIETADNQFILDDQSNNKSVDNDFEEYVQRQSHIEIKTEQKKPLIDFEPMILVTELNITPRPSRLARRTKHSKKRREDTQTSINKNEWSADVIKLKQARRRKKVLQDQLFDLRNQIQLLENPQKRSVKPKIKQMMKIADDSQANLKAIIFVRKMNNERRIKEEKLKMYCQRQDQQMYGRMQQMDQVGQHYGQKRRLKKAQEIAHRIEQYEKKRVNERKLKSINLAFVQKIKKKTESGLLPQLSRKKQDYRKVRNLSECNPQSIIEQYNRDIMMK